jgi:hypothetical protein
VLQEVVKKMCVASVLETTASVGTLAQYEQARQRRAADGSSAGTGGNLTAEAQSVATPPLLLLLLLLASPLSMCLLLLSLLSFVVAVAFGIGVV